MRLQEIFDQLSQGELSQIYTGQGLQGVTHENVQRVAHAINTGLTALHTRFFLREERLKLRLQPGRFTYPLTSKYAEATRDSKESVRYIEGSFDDNLLKIEQIFTDSGYELGLNDRDNPLS